MVLQKPRVLKGAKMGEDASKISASFFPGGLMPEELEEAF